MDAAGPLPSSRVAPSVKWTLCVGVYALLCAAGLLLLISQVGTLVAEMLELPSDSALWLAGPVPVIGAVVWWGVIERGSRYTYLFGGAVGLITGLLTLLFWVIIAAFVWGPKGVLAGWPLVVAVTLPTVPTAVIAGLPAMYARRRFGDGATDDS